MGVLVGGIIHWEICGVGRIGVDVRHGGLRVAVGVRAWHVA